MAREISTARAIYIVLPRRPFASGNHCMIPRQRPLSSLLSRMSIKAAMIDCRNTPRTVFSVFALRFDIGNCFESMDEFYNLL